MGTKWKTVALIGAAGKMGCTIAKLLTSKLDAEQFLFIDPNEKGLASLQESLKWGIYSTDLAAAKEATLIFEAAVEDIPVKVHILRELKKMVSPESYFLSNTSSIPIHLLEEKTGLQGRLMGFHFYNPAHKQRLVEIVAAPTLLPLGKEIASALDKIVVESGDVAGFIGNGHFIREVIYASQWPAGVMDLVTRDFLIRPMGIFQLVEYVGVEVYKKIARIMAEELQDKAFLTPLQFDRTEKIDLGPLPEGHHFWHEKMPLGDYERALRASSSVGAKLAVDYLDHSRSIQRLLVEQKIAKSLADVQTVLKNGFGHVLL